MKFYTQSQHTHLALTQFYRWFLVYEMPFTQARIDNQLDILAEEVAISSQAGNTKSKASLPDRLKMYEGWLNAHHVKRVEVTNIDDKNLSLEATILYQNIRPNDSRYSYTIHYRVDLELRPADLPLLAKVDIKTTDVVEPPEFIPSYAQNRAQSFMHYWLYLMENRNANAALFKELLADGFELDPGIGMQLSSWSAFEAWRESIRNQTKASAYTAKNLQVKSATDDDIQVTVDFEWQGINNKRQPITALYHHEWVLENNPDERFARLKKLKIKKLR
jgi:hypothetical protein